MTLKGLIVTIDAIISLINHTFQLKRRNQFGRSLFKSKSCFSDDRFFIVHVRNRDTKRSVDRIKAISDFKFKTVHFDFIFSGVDVLYLVA